MSQNNFENIIFFLTQFAVWIIYIYIYISYNFLLPYVIVFQLQASLISFGCFNMYFKFFIKIILFILKYVILI